MGACLLGVTMVGTVGPRYGLGAMGGVGVEARVFFFYVLHRLPKIQHKGPRLPAPQAIFLSFHVHCCKILP